MSSTIRSRAGTSGWSARRRVDRRLPEIAAKLDCRLLLLDIYEDPWWAWLGRTRPFPRRRGRDRGARARKETARAQQRGSRRRRVPGDQPTGDVGVSLHEHGATATHLPRDGARGHRASRPRRRGGVREGQLEPIVSSPRAEQLLATLEAYFGCDQNARATATGLGIHHQTVAQRLAAAEELIGQPPAARRAELELALRLRRQLAD